MAAKQKPIAGGPGRLGLLDAGCLVSQKHQTGAGIAHCAGHIQEIARTRAVPLKRMSCFNGAGESYADKEVTTRCRSVAADQVHVEAAAGLHETTVEPVD